MDDNEAKQIFIVCWRHFRSEIWNNEQAAAICERLNCYVNSSFDAVLLKDCLSIVGMLVALEGKGLELDFK